MDGGDALGGGFGLGAPLPQRSPQVPSRSDSVSVQVPQGTVPPEGLQPEVSRACLGPEQRWSSRWREQQGKDPEAGSGMRREAAAADRAWAP